MESTSNDIYRLFYLFHFIMYFIIIIIYSKAILIIDWNWI